MDAEAVAQGLQAAIEEHGRGDGVESAPVPSELLPHPPGVEGGYPRKSGPAPNPSPGSSGQNSTSSLPEKRGPGRPPGSKNKSAEAVRREYLAAHKSPLMLAGDVLDKSILDLARENRLKGEAAMNLWLGTLKAVLPYLHQKLPIAIEGEGGNITFNFTSMGGISDAVKASAVDESALLDLVAGRPEGADPGEGDGGSDGE